MKLTIGVDFINKCAQLFQSQNFIPFGVWQTVHRLLKEHTNLANLISQFNAQVFVKLNGVFSRNLSVCDFLLIVQSLMKLTQGVCFSVLRDLKKFISWRGLWRVLHVFFPLDFENTFPLLFVIIFFTMNAMLFTRSRLQGANPVKEF